MKYIRWSKKIMAQLFKVIVLSQDCMDYMKLHTMLFHYVFVKNMSFQLL